MRLLRFSLVSRSISTGPPHLRRRLRLVAGGALVVTALTTATAGAALPLADSQAATAATAQASQPRWPATTSGGFVLRMGLFGRGVDTPLRGVPGAAITAHLGINNHAQITGAFIDAAVVPDPEGAVDTGHGFVQDRRGAITTFEVPFWRLHNVSDINDRGQLVGAYLERGAAPNPDGTIPAGTVHGFVWERGRFASFDVPGSIFTQAFGINDRGQIAGGYYDATGTQHAFLQDRGRYQTLDAPGGNIAYGINDRGEIVLPDPRAARLLPVAT